LQKQLVIMNKSLLKVIMLRTQYRRQGYLTMAARRFNWLHFLTVDALSSSLFRYLWLRLNLELLPRHLMDMGG